jgi:hypothetical protein
VNSVAVTSIAASGLCQRDSRRSINQSPCIHNATPSSRLSVPDEAGAFQLWAISSEVTGRPSGALGPHPPFWLRDE